MSTEKPKVVMLISNNNPGGVFTSTKLIVKSIDRSKFYVIVVALGAGEMADQIGAYADEYHNLNVGTFPRLRKFKNGEYKDDFKAWLKLFLWLFRSVGRFTCWLLKNKVDLVHSNGTHFNIVSGVACKIARTSCIWHIRFPQNTGKDRNFLIRLVEGPLMALFPTRIIANSHFTYNTLNPAWLKKTTVIRNSIDVEDIAKNQKQGQLRRMAGVEDSEKLVGVMGIISYRKGMDRFIKMAAEVSSEQSNVKFVIIGGTPQEMEKKVKAELEELAAKLGLSGKIYFTGNIPDAAGYIGDLDAFFMCSRPGTETFGLVVVEAMAAGVPIVAFSSDAMPEIIEDGKNGFLVPDGDITLVKERILSILNDRELSEKLREEASRRVWSNFDIPVMMSGIQKLYLDLIK